MTLSRGFGVAISALALGLGLSYVDAQGSTSAVAEASSAEAAEPLPLLTDPAAQVAQAEGIVEQGGGIGEQVQAMLADARRERDVMRITCLEDKLSQLRAHQANGEERLAELRDAVSERDDESRAHQYTVLRVLSQKFRALAQEAAQCIGQDIGEIPAPLLGSDLPAGVEDPSVMPETPGPTVPYIPPPASGVS